MTLCGWWGRAAKVDAIRDFESGWDSYYVQYHYGRRVDVRVVNGQTGKYLRTNPNSLCSDNLDSLPNC